MGGMRELVRPDLWAKLWEQDMRRERMGGLRCMACKDTGHVCENHTNHAWPDECDCGAGMPCKRCCSPIPTGGSVIEAFTPDWKR